MTHPHDVTDPAERMHDPRRGIDELRQLRDAQESDSTYRDHYQTRITALTTELLTWEANVPQLAELDELIAAAARRVDRAGTRATRSGGALTRAAGVAAALGGLLTLASLAWNTPATVPTMGVLLLALAVGVVGLGVHIRRREVHRAAGDRAWLDELSDERRGLLPGEPRRGAAAIPVWFDGPPHAGLRDAGPHHQSHPAIHGHAPLRGLRGGGVDHGIGEFDGGHGDHDATRTR